MGGGIWYQLVVMIIIVGTNQVLQSDVMIFGTTFHMLYPAFPSRPLEDGRKIGTADPTN